MLTVHWGWEYLGTSQFNGFEYQSNCKLIVDASVSKILGWQDCLMFMKKSYIMLTKAVFICSNIQ